MRRDSLDRIMNSRRCIHAPLDNKWNERKEKGEKEKYIYIYIQGIPVDMFKINLSQKLIFTWIMLSYFFRKFENRSNDVSSIYLVDLFRKYR